MVRVSHSAKQAYALGRRLVHAPQVCPQDEPGWPLSAQPTASNETHPTAILSGAVQDIGEMASSVVDVTTNYDAARLQIYIAISVV
eukprot:5159769-Amphidinium_carterae.2